MNMRFLIIMLCYYLCLETVLQGVASNNVSKIELDAGNSGDIESYASALTHTRKNVKLIITNSKYRL